MFIEHQSTGFPSLQQVVRYLLLCAGWLFILDQVSTFRSYGFVVSEQEMFLRTITGRHGVSEASGSPQVLSSSSASGSDLFQPRFQVHPSRANSISNHAGPWVRNPQLQPFAGASGISTPMSPGLVSSTRSQFCAGTIFQVLYEQGTCGCCSIGASQQAWAAHRQPGTII